MNGTMVCSNPQGIISGIPRIPIFKNISNGKQNARCAALSSFKTEIAIESALNINGSFGEKTNTDEKLRVNNGFISLGLDFIGKKNDHELKF